MSTDRWMDMEAVVHIHNGILLSHKRKTFESVLMIWMNLEPIIGKGNGNPLQCSCLENPRDGGAWWAAVSGVTQSQTRLKWLSSSSSRAYYTEWSKSEREKQIPNTNACTWNLERWYWWNYLKSSNGDTDIENRLWTWDEGCWGRRRGWDV